MKNIFFLFLLVGLLVGCSGDESATSSSQIITVKLKPDTTTLYFNSTIEPLESYSLISPADGLAERHFSYGDRVSKGQLLFTIRSTQARNEYMSALSDYIKVKRDYDNSVNQMQAAK